MLLYILDKKSYFWLVYAEKNNYDKNNDSFQDCIADEYGQQFQKSEHFEIFNVWMEYFILLLLKISETGSL